MKRQVRQQVEITTIPDIFKSKHNINEVKRGESQVHTDKFSEFSDYLRHLVSAGWSLISSLAQRRVLQYGNTKYSANLCPSHPTLIQEDQIDCLFDHPFDPVHQVEKALLQVLNS
jgi:hypothetical protein